MKKLEISAYTMAEAKRIAYENGITVIDNMTTF